MTHPKPEEWVPYVYGETSAEQRGDLAAHLQQCPQCRATIDSWKHTLHRLDGWRVAEASRPSEILAPWLNWAAAAAILLFAGILIGRATSPKVDVEKLRASIAPEVRGEVSREMAQLVQAEIARNASATLASGHRYTDQVAQQLYAVLKKDVDTIALNADAGLRHTAEELVQLADYRVNQNPALPNQ